MSMILLTGATGYLGSQIAAELACQEAAFRVLVRDAARLEPEVGSRCEVVTGDLLDGGALRRALSGVTHVIHTAALVKMWVRDQEDFRRTNVEGLKALCNEAANAGVRRIIYTSSFIALGPSSDPKAGEGLSCNTPCSNLYWSTKVEALQWLRQEGFGRVPVITLLPGVIYGNGPSTEGNLVGGMIREYLAGRLPGLLGSGEQRWSFAYNSDVAAAHVTALTAGVPGEEYVLGGVNTSLNDFFRLLAELSGVKRPIRHLPFWAGRLVAGIELTRAHLTGRPPRLTPGVVKIFQKDWVYSSMKARDALGYRITPLKEGLASMLAAFPRSG